MKFETENNELSKTLDPKQFESKWYNHWEDNKYFAPKMGKQKKSYCIIMPPPNVTGKLHAGHALDMTTQDTIIRCKRMKGFKTLYLPSMDHAGIATQSVVEKKILEDEGKSRKDMTREEFLERIWKWKDEYGDFITKQARHIGVSCDWDYFVFTMDQGPHEAVNKVFCDLYNEGLIYQSNYIVNWDPLLQSAISDAEVEHKEVKGAFYHVLYSVKDHDTKLEIATTRPETMLGDTAVAVNPNDDRFKHLIGKTAIVPLCNREIPIIGDEHVDMELGTGCLKVTPGHDFNDFEIGKRHKLETINILNSDGTLNEYGLEWKSMSCKKARKLIVEKLKELGLFIKQHDHIHQVGHGQRSHVPIEPIVSKQWFLNVQEMASTAVKAIEDNKTRFYPKGWENTYFSWLREPRNWCISRQLWWGHQIPVYYCKQCENKWAAEYKPECCTKCDSKHFNQDPDVLDTWFSSGLWAFSTLGWPDKERMKEKGFNDFFPTSTLVTGYDIIFFWVARMMMMTLKVLGEIPFEKIYIHAIVRDKLGRKMSKSLGNGIDPIEMIDKYGSDAFRFALAAGSGYNRGLNLDSERISGYRNFMNKIWNAFRFIHPFISNTKSKLPDIQTLDNHEKWILGELNSVTLKMNESIEEFRFDDACNAIYQFVYDKYCSWFIELSKNVLYGDNEKSKIQRTSVLKYCFREIVALLHPISPFVTEEFWQYLKNDGEDLLIAQEYPEFDEKLVFDKDQSDMNHFIETITLIRNMRSALNIKPKDEISIELFSGDKELLKYFEKNKVYFHELARVKTIVTANKNGVRPPKSIMSATTNTEIFMPLEGVVDINEHIKRLEKNLEKTKKEFNQNDKKLKNKKFAENAPKDVIEGVKKKVSDLKQKIISLEENVKSFK